MTTRAPHRPAPSPIARFLFNGASLRLADGRVVQRRRVSTPVDAILGRVRA